MSENIETPRTIVLPPILDLTEAGPLSETLLSTRGMAMHVDASLVARLGGQCLQVLISAAKTWRADGLEFEIRQRSEQCEIALRQFGASSFFSDQREPQQ